MICNSIWYLQALRAIDVLGLLILFVPAAAVVCCFLNIYSYTTFYEVQVNLNKKQKEREIERDGYQNMWMDLPCSSCV